jgi:hypothetical protein
MFQYLKNTLARNIKNSFGWSTNRKIVVFTVDDYGSVRMASKTARENLRSAGLKIEKSKFDMFDALEDANDLSQLFDTLSSVKDKTNRSAVFTAMSLPANPNFEKMNDEGYAEYHYELLTDTWDKLAGYKDVKSLWNEGIEKRIIYPQFHGREHLNVKVLMELLQMIDKETIACFENRSFGAISTKLYSTISNVAAFEFDKFEENASLMQIADDGLNAFEKVFGFRARHFASPGAREHSCLAQTLRSGGIKFLDSDMVKKEHQGNGKYRRSIDYTGKRNSYNQVYFVRNCVFEPNPFDTIDWVNYALQQIEIAFRWNKPANISTHRVNFSGHIEPSNREKGLSMLKKLLKEIIKRWPDVEFMTTVELGDLIESTDNNK